MLSTSDIEEIIELKHRYFNAMDNHDWAAFGCLFALDARLDMSDAVQPDLIDPASDDGAVFLGRDEIVAFVSKTIAPFKATHLGSSPQVREDGPGRAKVSWVMEDILMRELDGVLKPVFRGYGTYYERCLKLDGKWFYSNVTLRRDRSASAE